MDPGTRSVAIETADAECEPCVANVPDSNVLQELVALRFEVGTLGTGLSLSFLSLGWKYFYWEIIRYSTGWTNEPWVVWGTAMGFPLHLGDLGFHEIRFGLGAMFGFLPPASDQGSEEFFGFSLAPQIYYVFHAPRYFDLEVGVDLTLDVFAFWGEEPNPKFSVFVGFRI